MDKKKIKEYVHEQKPIAEFGYIYDGFKNYSCIIVVDNIEEEVTFRVPISNCTIKLENNMSADDLTHWLV